MEGSGAGENTHNSPSSLDEPFIAPNETLYEFITRTARSASDRVLLGILGACLIIGGAAWFIPRLWPVIAGVGMVATIAGWGLLEHQRIEHPARWIIIVERLLVVLGSLFAVVMSLGFLYLVLGSGWIS